MNWLNDIENGEFTLEDSLEEASIVQILLRKTAIIYHREEKGIFLKDTVSETYMLSTSDLELGKEWLKVQEHEHYELMEMCQPELAEYCKERYHFENVMECKQAVYTGNPIEYKNNLDIREAAPEDLEFIRTYYQKLSDEELRMVQSRHNLFIGYVNDEPVGFIGNHLEGSIGLLEILPEHRRKGYGLQLEYFMINRMLQKKLLPFGQIETWNDKSFALQRKAGMKISENNIYWLF